jgi:hypothetical protein
MQFPCHLTAAIRRTSFRFLRVLTFSLLLQHLLFPLEQNLIVPDTDQAERQGTYDPEKDFQAVQGVFRPDVHNGAKSGKTAYYSIGDGAVKIILDPRCLSSCLENQYQEPEKKEQTGNARLSSQAEVGIMDRFPEGENIIGMVFKIEETDSQKRIGLDQPQRNIDHDHPIWIAAGAYPFEYQVAKRQKYNRGDQQ